jgi:hypothetical protein
MSVEAEFRQRLYNAAEAFYYAGILTSLPFDAANVEAGDYRHVQWAADAAIAGKNPRNHLGAPPIVNLGLALELYLKLLIGKRVREHDLHKLFLTLEKDVPQTAKALIRNHHYSRGCREEFVEVLKAEASVFEDWRYAHESELLISSPDTLLALAKCCRKTVTEMCPDLRSAFTRLDDE